MLTDLLTQREQSFLAVMSVLEAIRLECESNILATLNEMHLKVVALNALLEAGFVVLEGSSRNRVKALHLVDGRLDVTHQVRAPLMAHPGEATSFSADIRVGDPASLVVELKARSIHGSQDAIGSETILKDLERVGRRTVDLFVLAADRELYDRLRGLGRDSRGRKARAPDLFVSVMPASESLGPRFASEPVSMLGGHFEVLGSCIMSAAGTERVVIGCWRGRTESISA